MQGLKAGGLCVVAAGACGAAVSPLIRPGLEWGMGGVTSAMHLLGAGSPASREPVPVLLVAEEALRVEEKST